MQSYTVAIQICSLTWILCLPGFIALIYVINLIACWLGAIKECQVKFWMSQLVVIHRLCLVFGCFYWPLELTALWCRSVDYCDATLLTIVMPLCWLLWCLVSSTAELNCLTERIHSKFVKPRKFSHRSQFSFTMLSIGVHTAIRIFKSLHQVSPPYLYNFKGYNR